MKIRRIVSVFLLAVLMSILCLPPLAYADEPLDIQAKAALLVDGSSGRVLYAKNEHEELYPASITKVTTALLVFEAIERGDLRLDQTVTASASALAGQDPDGSTAGRASNLRWRSFSIACSSSPRTRPAASSPRPSPALWTPSSSR